MSPCTPIGSIDHNTFRRLGLHAPSRPPMGLEHRLTSLTHFVDLPGAASRSDRVGRVQATDATAEGGRSRAGPRGGVGVVVIGRNEATRVKDALASVPPGTPVVYVDSGSVDGSPQVARTAGAEVIELDPSRPFSAARGRNAGWRRLAEREPSVGFVQFLDGDCRLEPGWIEAGVASLVGAERTAIVFGRLRELHPEASVYNRLCDVEWDGEPGEAEACGGIAMARLEALEAANGFDESLIAGEEPDLCIRLRGMGWSIRRLPDAMARHDADMHTVRQWWNRCRRGGYAFARLRWMHRHGPAAPYPGKVTSICVWGAILPAIAVALVAASPWALLALLAYPAQVVRLWMRLRRRGRVPPETRLAYAVHCVACKFPEFFGVARFAVDRIRGRQTRLIEHKLVPDRY